MKFLLRLCGLFLVLACLPATAQISSLTISKVEIQHVGPQSVSDELIRANVRVKPGDPYIRAAVDEDIRTLYATHQFYDIRIQTANTPDGIILTYVLQGNPKLVTIKFQGNKKIQGFEAAEKGHRQNR